MALGADEIMVPVLLKRLFFDPSMAAKALLLLAELQVTLPSRCDTL